MPQMIIPELDSGSARQMKISQEVRPERPCCARARARVAKLKSQLREAKSKYDERLHEIRSTAAELQQTASQNEADQENLRRMHGEKLAQMEEAFQSDLDQERSILAQRHQASQRASHAALVQMQEELRDARSKQQQLRQENAEIRSNSQHLAEANEQLEALRIEVDELRCEEHSIMLN